MKYELWDHESKNLLGVYRTERAALLTVLEAIQDHGRDSAEVSALMLGYNDGQGGGRVIAEGPQLAELALRHAGSRRASA
jgi:hypothetical protein